VWYRKITKMAVMMFLAGAFSYELAIPMEYHGIGE
jgi:hypothetical protein